MTKPDHVTDLLIDYLQEELSQQQVTDVETHLNDCSICREEKDVLSNILKGAKSHQYPDPGEAYWGGFSDRFHTRLDSTLASGAALSNNSNNVVNISTKPVASRKLWTKNLAAVAAVTLVVSAIFLFNGSPSEPTARFNIALSQQNILDKQSSEEYRLHAESSLAVLHPEDANPNLFAFAPIVETASFFSIGTHYAQTTAAIKKNNPIAVNLLALLKHDLEAVNQPAILSALEKLQLNLSESFLSSASSEVSNEPLKNLGHVREDIKELQHSLEQYFSGRDRGRAATLFYTGAWLYNVELASVVNNTNAVQDDVIFSTLIEALTRIEIEPGVTRSMVKIETLLNQNKLQKSDKDELKLTVSKSLDKELRNIRQILGYR